MYGALLRSFVQDSVLEAMTYRDLAAEGKCKVPGQRERTSGMEI
jgi:hypothetical protein